MASNTITVRILGDASQFQRTIGKVDQEAKGLGGRLVSFAKGAGGALAAAGIAKFGKDSVQAFVDAERAQAKLQAAFAKFPTLAGANVKELEKLNEALARKTRFDDDATASAQAVLASFNLTAEQLKAVTPLVQDYAARTGKDLTAAAADVGKAILGQGRALKAIGVSFKDTGSAAGNFAAVTDALRAKVGGFAEREGNTTAGKLAILKNQFGELQEEIGSKLLPVLSKLASAVLAVVNWFNNLSPAAKTVVGVLAAMVGAITAVSLAVKAYTAVQAVLNATLLANPIGLVIAAIAALVAGIVIAYNKSETFRNIVDAVGRALRTAWEWIVKVAGTVFDLGKRFVEFYMKYTPVGVVLSNLPKILGVVRDAFGWVVDKIRALWEWLGKIPKAIDKALGPLDELLAKAGKLAGGALGTLGKVVGKIPGFQTGGVVPGPVGVPRLAIVHGGERVLTPQQQAQSGTVYHQTFNAYGTAPGEVVREWESKRRLAALVS